MRSAKALHRLTGNNNGDSLERERLDARYKLGTKDGNLCWVAVKQ